MFSYYGSKSKLVDYYPPPKHGLIIEPFAGSARYALKYWDREVILIDKYEIVVRIWKWLQKCSPADILKLPILKEGENIRDYKLDCEEAYWYMGFVIAAASQSPRKKASSRATTQRPKRIATRLRVCAENLHKIKHWNIVQGSFNDAPDVAATWFVDPPYENGGHVYVKSNKNIDFIALANWCRSLSGQVIVCENTQATWMDFKPLVKMQGCTRGTTEAIWCNEPTNYDNVQLQLF